MEPGTLLTSLICFSEKIFSGEEGKKKLVMVNRAPVLPFGRRWWRKFWEVKEQGRKMRKEGTVTNDLFPMPWERTIPLKGCERLAGLNKRRSILFPFLKKSCTMLLKDRLKGARDGKIGSNHH